MEIIAETDLNTEVCMKLKHNLKYYMLIRLINQITENVEMYVKI